MNDNSKPGLPAEQDLVELAARALRDVYADKVGGDFTEERLREMVTQATRGLKGRMNVAPATIEELVASIAARPSFSASLEYGRRQISRWFEVALDEFDLLPLEQLRPDTLMPHLFYEQRFASWLGDLGYTVKIGEELEGIEGADFIPDVYATLETLHGRFQIAVTLFCSNPPNTYRVLAMLENIEAFAPKGSEFGERDIYFLVTPYKFLEQANNHIRIQAHQEDYFVVTIEGNDLQDLEHAANSEARRERLQDLVLSAARAKGTINF